ncbi:hypothetical protein GCM10010275_46980 [Streptomyces litmocidini]|nr:hypothetical protein GCM10010275_46980 [Streptomyces litmocidini]
MPRLRGGRGRCGGEEGGGGLDGRRRGLTRKIHGGGRPAGFDKEKRKRRNEVERTINGLQRFRAVATRYGKRACVFHGTVTVASVRPWLSP